jgi:hypothetical protein
VKDFFVYRIVCRLTLSLIVVICVLMAGTVPARAAQKARVVVGFVGSPPSGFQNVLLNVQAVRINPRNNPSPTGGGWQRIPTPPGIGGQGQNAELQIDLNASQNIPQLFNTVGVKPNTYHTAELLLDPNNPGVLIPNCPQSPGGGEGCIVYPISLNGGNLISVNDPGSGGLVAAGKGQLGVLMLNVTVMKNQAPTTPGGPFSVTITVNTVPPNSVQGVVTGMVTVSGSGSSGSSKTKVRALGVTAEAIGTNTEIANSPVKTAKGCPPSPGGCFTLALPAAGGLNGTANGFGTLYDLAVAGGGATYAATRLLPLYPGQTSPTAVNFSLTGKQMLGNITGQVLDACTAGDKTGIIGATLELLIPPTNNSGANCLTNPELCVTVATENSNNTGGFPLPGGLLVPSPFTNVPILPKNAPYVMKVTAPGYDDLLVLAKPSPQTKSNGGTCSVNGGPFTKCNLMMNRGTITGTIPITPPLPGQTTLVQVFAEDAGTNNVRGALPMPVRIKASNPGAVNFTVNVPTANPALPFRTFDLFATTIDLYQGFTDPYQGHTVAVLSGVQIPNTTACSTATATFPPDQIIDCIGHGSITGQVQNPNLGTSVVLSKQGVQLNSSIVENQAPLPDPTSNYSFCVPADTYDVQRFQLPLPDPNMTPLAMPTPLPVPGDIVTVTIPPAPLAGGASPTPTPALKCPTTCSNMDGTCPGICNNMIAPML